MFATAFFPPKYPATCKHKSLFFGGNVDSSFDTPVPAKTLLEIPTKSVVMVMVYFLSREAIVDAIAAAQLAI